jgi:hypothetical protein
MSADSVSTNVFGAPCPTTTNAPGSSAGNAEPNALNPAGDAVNDFASGVSNSAETGSVGYFPGVGGHDQSDVSGPDFYGQATTTDTGAGHGSVSHDFGGLN